MRKVGARGWRARVWKELYNKTLSVWSFGVVGIQSGFRIVSRDVFGWRGVGARFQGEFFPSGFGLDNGVRYGAFLPWMGISF